jgi:hypothetical protein
MKASELLSDARDELFQGWEKGTLLNESTGGVCAVGALRRSCMNNIQNGAAAVFGKARDALNVKSREMSADVGINGTYPLRVEEFNDWAKTEKSDVLNMFDKAIIGLEEQGN